MLISLASKDARACPAIDGTTGRKFWNLPCEIRWWPIKERLAITVKIPDGLKNGLFLQILIRCADCGEPMNFFEPKTKALESTVYCNNPECSEFNNRWSVDMVTGFVEPVKTFEQRMRETH